MRAVGVDHWYEEDGRVFVILTNGNVRAVPKDAPMNDPKYLDECVKCGIIAKRNISKKCAKMRRNNTERI